MIAMPDNVRALVYIALVLSSRLAAAQVVDPWSPDAPSVSEPASPQPSSASSTSPLPPPTQPAAAATNHTGRLIDPWQKPMPTTLTMRRPGDWIAHPAPILRPRRQATEVVYAPATAPEEPQSTRRYPFELAARPLLLPAGVTELGVSYERTSAVRTTGGPYGGVMRGRVSTGTPDLYLVHSFSRVEAGIGVGQLGYGWIAFDTRSFPQRVQLSVAFSAPQQDGSYAHSQSLSGRHKLMMSAQGNAALVVNAGLYLSEVFGYNANFERVAGEFFSTNGSLTLQVQLAQRLAMSFTGGGSVPLGAPEKLDLEGKTYAATGLLIAFHSWDVVASGIIWFPVDEPALFMSAGFRKRWGL